jgi:signal transduction histidine kinase
VSRRLRAALTAAAAGLTALFVVTFYHGGWPGAAGPPIYLITPALVLVAYLGVGLAAWQRYPAERIGLLFTVVGYEWYLQFLPQLHYALPFTIGNLAASLYQAGLAHLGLAWPYGRLRSRLDRTVVAGNYCWNLGNTAAQMLWWNPNASGCHHACPANLLFVSSSAGLSHAVSTITTVIGTCMTAVIIAMIARHWWTARGYARLAMTSLVWVALPIGAYITVLGLPVSVPSLLLYGIGPLILIAAPVAYLCGMIRVGSTRRAVGAALVELEPGPPPTRLRDALAWVLRDPTLQLAFRVADHDGYVDTADHAVDPGRLPAGRQLAPLGPAAQAVLVYDEELRHEPELIRVAVAAASLALEHARLQGEVEAQLEQVRASRARIVEAGDAERRRLERDLHDGAQQRLVTLSLALGMARHRAAADPELAELIESASKEAAEALVELRELARGIHPAILTETGLSGAVQALVERSPLAATITAVPAGRFPAAIEATAYFVVCEALANVAKHSLADSVQVAIRQMSGRLLVEVTDDGAGGASPGLGSGLRGLADRVASVGGVLRIDSPPGRGTRLKADIPYRAADAPPDAPEITCP